MRRNLAFLICSRETDGASNSNGSRRNKEPEGVKPSPGTPLAASSTPVLLGFRESYASDGGGGIVLPKFYLISLGFFKRNHK